MKRVNINEMTQKATGYEIGSENQDFLIPQLRPSKESCVLELPGGKEVELPLLEGSEGPKSIDGR